MFSGRKTRGLKTPHTPGSTFPRRTDSLTSRLTDSHVRTRSRANLSLVESSIDTARIVVRNLYRRDSQIVSNSVEPISHASDKTQRVSLRLGSAGAVAYPSLTVIGDASCEMMAALSVKPFFGEEKSLEKSTPTC